MTPFPFRGFRKAQLALAASALLLALSVLLMASATYAWFFDSVVNQGNVIRCPDAPASDAEARGAEGCGDTADPGKASDNAEDAISGGELEVSGDLGLSSGASESGEPESQSGASHATEPSPSPDGGSDSAPGQDAGG